MVKKYTAVHGEALPVCMPEEAGLKSSCVRRFVERCDRENIRLSSFILMRDGKKFAEAYYAPYHRDSFISVHSLSKAFTSMGFGIAVSEGIIRAEDTVGEVFRDEIEAMGLPERPEFASWTFDNLLKMSAGCLRLAPVDGEKERDYIRTFLTRVSEDAPGKTFRYDWLCTYMCSAALKKKGVDLEAYLQEKLFDPLGIGGCHWLRDFRGTPTGGFGISVFTEAIAKFGELIRNDGVYEGRQILPADWVRLATTKRIDNRETSPYKDWRAGYGYQFWMCDNGSFRGDGAMGQLCIINREKRTVFAVNAFLDDMQPELDALFEEILEPMGDAALPADPEGAEALGAFLKTLKRPELPMTEDTGAVLASPLTVTGTKEHFGAYRVTADSERFIFEGDDLRQELFHQHAHPVRIEILRGPIRRETVPYEIHMGDPEVKIETERYAGYSVTEEGVEARVFMTEFMTDLRFLIRKDGDALSFTAEDVHDLQKIRKLL